MASAIPPYARSLAIFWKPGLAEDLTAAKRPGNPLTCGRQQPIEKGMDAEELGLLTSQMSAAIEQLRVITRQIAGNASQQATSLREVVDTTRGAAREIAGTIEVVRAVRDANIIAIAEGNTSVNIFAGIPYGSSVAVAPLFTVDSQIVDPHYSPINQCTQSGGVYVCPPLQTSGSIYGYSLVGCEPTASAGSYGTWTVTDCGTHAGAPYCDRVTAGRVSPRRS